MENATTSFTIILSSSNVAGFDLSQSLQTLQLLVSNFLVSIFLFRAFRVSDVLGLVMVDNAW